MLISQMILDKTVVQANGVEKVTAEIKFLLSNGSIDTSFNGLFYLEFNDRLIRKSAAAGVKTLDRTFTNSGLFKVRIISIDGVMTGTNLVEILAWE